MWLGCSHGPEVVRAERGASTTAELSPGGADAASALSDGISLFRSGELRAAARHFKRVRISEPSNWMAPYYLGLIALAQDRWQAAEADLHRSLKLAPDEPRVRCRIYIALGEAAEGQGRAASAKLSYLTALNLWPGAASAQDALSRLEHRESGN
jgi:Flp pilus assembly protein TadD